MEQIDQFFHISQKNTTLGREVRGGITTFCSMAYLILLIPSLLSGAGMDFNEVLTATCLITAIGSIVAGLTTNLPFALAPGLGFTTLFTHTMCQQYGCTWQQALALVFVSGILFLCLEISPFGTRLNDVLPMPFKFALSAGVGLFLTLAGLINAGLITADNNMVDMGALSAPEPLLALLGIFITAVLIMKKVPGALVIGMVLTAVIGIPVGVTVLPQNMISVPVLSLNTLKPDFSVFLKLSPIPLFSTLLSLVVSQHFDAVGTLLGVAGDAKLTDNTGDLAGQREAMLCCGATTCLGAFLGVSNVTAMGESATGIREGARTGLSAVITGLLFLCMLFFAPLAGLLSGAALAAPLVMVGMSMMSGITQITWKHVEISLPCFLMIVGMPFTSSITTGVMLGVVSYVVVMVLRKRAHLIDPVLYIIAAVFVLNAALYTLI